MKKLAAVILASLLLGGCAISEEDLPNQILTQLQGLQNQELAAGNNMKKQYYSYYLPPGVGRRDSNALSEVFMKDGYRVIMNFDPSAIVINAFYKETQEDVETAASVNTEFQAPSMKEEDGKIVYTGNYLTNTYQVHPYTLQVVSNQDSYLLYLDGEIVKMYTFVPRAEVTSMMKMMLRMMASIKYDEKYVLQNFSMKSLEDTNRKSLDYLEQNLPSSGSLSEILTQEEQPGVGDSTEKEITK